MKALNIVGDTASCTLASKVNDALNAALAKTDLDPDVGIYSIDGMSGKKYRYFINTLIGSLEHPRYLEVGSWMGSTLCSAIHGNKVEAVAIDNWSEFGGPKTAFIDNVNKFITPGARASLVESDFRQVDFAGLPALFGMGGPFNVYLFDGPHEAVDQYQGVALALPCLDNQFVFIVDDWNWIKVRDGTTAALLKCGLTILYAAAIRTTDHNGSPDHILPIKDWRAVRDFDWHNGYFIAVLEKGPAPTS